MEPVESRFWSKVHIVDDDDSCWEWQASRGPLPWNYGKFSWRKAPVPQLAKHPASAHRVAFYLTYGYVPDHTCHHCDNPPCVRPSHLFAGDHVANMADRDAKGRGVSGFGHQAGEANHHAILTDEIVLEIRHLVAGGASEQEVATRFGVSRPSVTLIRQGKTWKHVGGPTSAEGGRRKKLTDAQVTEIRSRAGERRKDLAAEYGVSVALIGLIVRGKHR